MQVNVGKPVKDKKFCDACQQPTSEDVRECQLPYQKQGPKKGGLAQWFDLCPRCIAILQQHPTPFVMLETPIRSLVSEQVSATAGA